MVKHTQIKKMIIFVGVTAAMLLILTFYVPRLWHLLAIALNYIEFSIQSDQNLNPGAQEDAIVTKSYFFSYDVLYAFFGS